MAASKGQKKADQTGKSWAVQKAMKRADAWVHKRVEWKGGKLAVMRVEQRVETKDRVKVVRLAGQWADQSDAN